MTRQGKTQVTDVSCPHKHTHKHALALTLNKVCFVKEDVDKNMMFLRSLVYIMAVFWLSYQS